MVIYEVNLRVENAVADDYAAWLKGHIAKMLAFKGFKSVRWLDNEGEDADACNWVVQYMVEDRASLDDYFANHAEAMRRDGLERFAGRFSATRRILEVKLEMGGRRS
jgi:hypothetical protein